MSNLHDHLWIDILQHTCFFVEQDEKRIWNYRHHLMFCACEHGSIRAVNAMISSGANVNICKNQGMTPLLFACWFNYVDVVKVLLAAGVDVNSRTIVGGRTPLSVSKNNKIRKMLLAAGAIE